MILGGTSRDNSEGGYGNAGEHPERLRSGEERGVPPLSSDRSQRAAASRSHTASGSSADACASERERSSLASLPPKAKNSRPQGGTASGRKAGASAEDMQVYPEGIIAPEKASTCPTPPYLLGGDNCQKQKFDLKEFSGTVGIDWIQGTIPLHHAARLYDYFSKMCDSLPELFTWGRFRYERHCVWHPFGIKMFWDADPEKSEMHKNRVAIQLTGQSLQDFDAVSLFNFLRDLAFEFEFNATRIDLCFDDYEKVKMPHEVSRIAEDANFTGFKRWKPEQERRITGEYLSDCIYFGQRGKNGSGRYLRCYDKALESLGEIDAVRWEVEFSKDAAKSVFRKLTESGDIAIFTGLIGAIIGGSIDFIDRKGTHLDRMQRLDWWQRIRDILGCIKLRNPKRLKSIEQTINWVEASVAASLKKVQSAIGHDYFEDWLDEILNTAQLRKYQKAQIQYYWNRERKPKEQTISPY